MHQAPSRPYPKGRRRSRRTRAGVAAAGLALISLGTASMTVPVGAQDSPPPAESAIAPYDPANFMNGEAASSGQTFRFNIKQGNADIGLTYGSVLATYRDKTGKSDSRALDLGVFPTLFGVEQCDGSPPILNPATFPPKSIADSNEAGSDVAKPAVAFMPGFGKDPAGERVGTQTATATKQPSSTASTVSEDADMFFIAIIGGKSEATTSLKDHVREARAVVTARELKVLGGLFTFENPRWEAVAKSGKVLDTTGSFTFSRATVLGIPRTPEQALADFAEFKYQLETLLGPLGAQLELPKVVVTDNKVEVTPMTFRLVDPPFGKELIRPFLGNIQPQREAWVREQLAADCKNETNLMLGDIVLGLLSGSGAVEIHAGGADAWTDDTDFTVPDMDDPIEPITEVAGEDAVEGTPDIPDSEYLIEDPGVYIPGTDGDYGYDDFDDTYDADTDDLTDLEATTTTEAAAKPTKAKKSKDKHSGVLADNKDLAQSKAGTAAVAVGLAGLLGAIGLTMGEHLRDRRTRRRIP